MVLKQKLKKYKIYLLKKWNILLISIRQIQDRDNNSLPRIRKYKLRYYCKYFNKS